MSISRVATARITSFWSIAPAPDTSMRRIEPLIYFDRFVADVRHRTQTAMSQQHVFTVCRLSLQAQARAVMLPLPHATQQSGAFMTRKIGVAIVGLGPASQPHSKSLTDLADRVDVRWAVSRSAERTKAYSGQFPFPTTNDMDAAISDPTVEAVIVLTPPSSHLEVAEKCLAAGKHVLVEKPLELTLARAERLVAIANASGLRFGVVLQHRFRPCEHSAETRT